MYQGIPLDSTSIDMYSTGVILLGSRCISLVSKYVAEAGLHFHTASPNQGSVNQGGVIVIHKEHPSSLHIGSWAISVEQGALFESNDLE